MTRLYMDENATAEENDLYTARVRSTDTFFEWAMVVGARLADCEAAARIASTLWDLMAAHDAVNDSDLIGQADRVLRDFLERRDTDKVLRRREPGNPPDARSPLAWMAFRAREDAHEQASA